MDKYVVYEKRYIAKTKRLKYNIHMLTTMKKYKGITIKAILIVLLVIFTVILTILKTNSDICEAWTRGFARVYQSTIGMLFKWIPFSLTEVLVVTIVIVGIILLVQFIRRLVQHKYSEGINKMLIILLVVSSVIALYQATAEMAYNRHSQPIQVYEEKVEKTEFRKINDYFIKDMNEVSKDLQFEENGDLICPYSISEMNDLLAEEFKRLDNDYDGYFTSFTTRAKPMVSSFIYRELHITGVTFMPTTEGNINYLNVNALKPITFAHEILHTKGVMKEEDADFIALYLMLTSNNSYFRYSGYYFSLSSLNYLASLTGVETDYEEVINSLNINYKNNRSFGSQYWKEHNAFADFGNWINDLYLKISGEKEGTDSYNDTPTHVDPDKKEVISFSLYQKLYFKLYYDANKE